MNHALCHAPFHMFFAISPKIQGFRLFINYVQNCNFYCTLGQINECSSQTWYIMITSRLKDYIQLSVNCDIWLHGYKSLIWQSYNLYVSWIAKCCPTVSHGLQVHYLAKIHRYMYVSKTQLYMDNWICTCIHACTCFLCVSQGPDHFLKL